MLPRPEYVAGTFPYAIDDALAARIDSQFLRYVYSRHFSAVPVLPYPMSATPLAAVPHRTNSELL